MGLAQLPRPKLQLALPYAAYRLTRADGAPLERTDKHPFCMSRCLSHSVRVLETQHPVKTDMFLLG